MRESFVLHRAQLEPINDLSFEEKGKLFDAIVNYQFDGITPELTGELKMAFRFIKNQLDIDNKKYQVIVERNRENGAKGGRPKKPTGLSGNPEKPDEPKKAENENENDLSFVQFWDLYNKKTGKQKAQKLWKKLTLTEKEQIINHIPLYKQSTPEKQFRKNPDTYLRNRAWEDEIIKPTNGHHKENSKQKTLVNEYTPGY